MGRQSGIDVTTIFEIAHQTYAGSAYLQDFTDKRLLLDWIIRKI